MSASVQIRLLLFLCVSLLFSFHTTGQEVNIIAGRPTDHSISLNLLSDLLAEIYIDYGTRKDDLDLRTRTLTINKVEPLVIELDELLADTRYYYRYSIKSTGQSGFSPGNIHDFHTQRSQGSTFSFTVEADPHPYDKKGCHNLWYIALQNQLKDSADFMFDLGDTFGDDHQPFTITSEQVRQLQLDCREFFGSVCHSLPLFFCQGNHEGESGYYLLQTPPNNLAVYETLWRKMYYPNPVPDGFYSGNTDEEPYGIGKPGNYYAWEWGDALFVVLDAYRYYTASAKPRNWDWTIGKAQYDWFRQTLENSRSKYKFVFMHHIAGESRGAVKIAKLYEWGGYNSKGDWEFEQYRPGWELPIHQLMVKHHVDIFFQGHDHLFAKEVLDGIVYQEVPMPDDSTYSIGMLASADAYESNQTGGAGHLRVTVNPDSVRVDFVQAYLPADENANTHNGQVAFSYSLKGASSSVYQENTGGGVLVAEQNYPNPFWDLSTIKYRIPAPADVRILLTDLHGREVARLVDQSQTEGWYSVTIDPREFALPEGIYYCRLTAGSHSRSLKMIYLKNL